MAIESVDGLEAGVAGKATDKPKGKKKLIVLATLALVVLAGAGGATYYFLSERSAGEGRGEGVSEAEGHGAEASAPPIYFSLEPAITVNFQRGGRTRFLQVSMSVMAHEQASIDNLQQHMPVVRNNLNLLFSSQEYESLSTREGKEALRQAALKAIRDVLTERAGAPGIDEVYFTGFVMQ